MRAKNVGTLSKKLKMPEITDADRALAAVQVEMQNIRQEIMEMWKRLKVRRIAATAQHSHVDHMTDHVVT